ncbi:uncharacterized protein LOC135582175 [Musa acuminata AAA Group]|uniref:uncharacterized protein LOC135582175 n=1 Tax=Musa acuminata AAA Group TaxID=214697 RepID=UPI0031D4C72C
MSASGKPPHFLTNISACRPISGWESIISLPAVSVNSFQAASHGKASTLIFFFTPIWSQRSSFRVPIRPQAMEDHGQEAFVLGDGVLFLHSFGQHSQEGLPLVSADGIPCKYDLVVPLLSSILDALNLPEEQYKLIRESSILANPEIP